MVLTSRYNGKHDPKRLPHTVFPGPRLGKKFYRSSSDSGMACEFISNFPRAQAGVPTEASKNVSLNG